MAIDDSTKDDLNISLSEPLPAESQLILEQKTENKVDEDRIINRNYKSKSQRWSEFAMSVSTVILACATLWLAYVSNKQLNIMENTVKATQDIVDNAIKQTESGAISANAAEKSAAAAEKSARLAERALIIGDRPYVSVEGIKMENFIEGASPSFVLSYKNFGRTPANNLISNIWYRSFNVRCTSEEMLVFRPVDGMQSKSPLLPGAVRLVIKTWDKVLSTADIKAVREERIFLYVYGRIKYESKLAGQHETKFCFVYNPNINFFDTCPIYNSVE